MLDQRFITQKIEQQLQDVFEQSIDKTLINISYKNLKKSKDFCLSKFMDKTLKINGEKYFKSLTSEIQYKLHKKLSKKFFKYEINYLAKSFVAAYSLFNCWPRIISSLCESCRFLSSLKISSCKIDDEVLLLISKADWKFVKNLDLSNNNISWKGVQYLSNCEWTYLTQLKLDRNHITNKGLSYLFNNDWQSLTSLSIQQNSLSPDGLKYLNRCSWRNLSQLHLGDVFGNDAFKRIRRLQIIQSTQQYFISLNCDDCYNLEEVHYNMNQSVKISIQNSCNFDVPFTIYCKGAFNYLMNLPNIACYIAIF